MKTACAARRDRDGNLAVLLMLLALLVLLGITYLGRAGGERRLTARLLATDHAGQIAEAAIAESFLAVQRTINVSGSAWFDLVRAPAARGGARQGFDAVHARALLEELTGSEPGGTSIECTLELTGVAPLSGLAAEPAEKSGYVRSTASVRVGDVTRSVANLRELRVARVFPPAPLDRWSVWVFSGAGAGAAPAGGSSAGPLDPAVQRLLETGWTYGWGGSRSRFPFARGRVSEYYADWQRFLEERRATDGTLELAGIVVVGDTADRTLQGGRIRGNGALWLPDGSLTLSGVDLDSSDSPQIAVLGGGKKLELTGYPQGARISARLAVPDGRLVTEPGMTLEGFVYADRWSRPAGTTVRAPMQGLELLATLSEVALVP